MQAPLTRRQFVAGSMAFAGTVGCARRPGPGAEPRVSVVRASYGGDLLDRVRRLFVDHSVELRGKRVVLKPNLVEFDSDTAVNTSPALVLAVLEACRALGAASVKIAEGPGHRRTTWDLAEAAGYFNTIPDFESIFTDLNLDDISEVTLPRSAKGLHSLWLPRTALDCDLLVSLPKMKTHHWVGVTLGMKNLFGLVPGAVYGWPKNVLHWAGIEESILAINSAVPNMFTIVDGVEGMEGNGPIQGKRKHAGVLVAGGDRVAVDATCCRIMGVNPELVRYLAMAQTLSQTQEANVRQIGERLEAVRTEFELIPEFGVLRLETS
jgi:uncharacterized protein (DUF362 family)